MTKKKEILRSILTQEEWDTFIHIFSKVEDIAFLYKKVREARKERSTFFYPNYLKSPQKTGVYIVDPSDNYETEEWVPIEFLLNPDPYLEEADRMIEEYRKENEKLRCNSEFHQYLKLKEKFKDVEEPPC